MSRRRYISTDISTDAKMRKLSDSAALFWTWMIPHANDDATITSDPDELAAIVVPNRPGWSPNKVETIIAYLQELDLLTTLNGTMYFDTNSFYRYQSNVPVDKRRTENPCKQGFAENSTKQHKTAQNSTSPSPSPSPIKHMSDESDQSRLVFDYWRERMNHPGARFSPDRQRKIAARLRDGLTVERLKEAVDGCAASSYHMGENDTGTVYDSIELIFRNVSKVEEFAARAHKRPGEKPPDLRAKERRIANAKAQLAAGMDEGTARNMVLDEDEWRAVLA